MVYEPMAIAAQAPHAEGHFQGSHVVFRPHVVGHGMTHDTPGIDVHDENDVEVSIADFEVCQITGPQLVDIVELLVCQQVPVTAVGAGEGRPGLVAEDLDAETVADADANKAIPAYTFGSAQIIDGAQAHGWVNLAGLHDQSDHQFLLAQPVSLSL